MKKLFSRLAYVTLGLNGLLIILAIFSEKITPPAFVQVFGRLHPLMLHLPIGFLIVIAFVLLFTKQEINNQITPPLLALTALLTVATSLAGLVLSREGGYEATLVSRHMNMGVILSVLLALFSQWPLHHWGTRKRQWAVFACLMLVAITGHLGAVLTHGENYILAPIQKSAPTTQPVDSSAFALAVRPVLEAKCVSCHNPKKKKGDLILSTTEGIAQGGESGNLIVAGNPTQSALLTRTLLPLEHDDHMPPSGKPQLTDNEKLLLNNWIKAGADFSTLVTTLLPTDTLRILASIVSNSYQKALPKNRYDLPEMEAATVQKLNSPFRTVKPIASNEQALKVDIFLAQYFKETFVTELSVVQANIVQLNMSGLPITDALANTLAQFKNLEVLNLNSTPITDKALPIIAALPKLAVLKISGTAISVQGLAALANSKSIKTIYAWNTKATPAEWANWATNRSGVFVFTGYATASTEVLPLTPPIIKNDNPLLAPGEQIALKHNLAGTKIHYTLDGTKPDSTHGALYEAPIAITKNSTLRAVAIREGWRMSREATQQFFIRGIAPAQAKLHSTPNKDYRAKGARTFTDLVFGDQENFRDGNWMGFRETKLEATFTFPSDKPVNQITVVYLRSIASYIMPPETIEIWAGNDENSLQLVHRENPEQPTGQLPNAMGAAHIKLKAAAPTLKIIVKPVAKLPAWHPGKGEKGWAMVSEVMFK